MELPKMMKAVMKTKPGPGAQLVDIPVPVPDEGELLVRVKACAICGTDIHSYEWNAWAQEKAAKHPGDIPRIIGHEFCGEIVSLGKGVKGYSIGERVVSDTHVPCGSCYMCRTGKAFNCQNIKRMKNGVFAQYAIVSTASAVKVPDEISDEVAATLEPFGVAVHAFEHTNVLGDTVAVLGAGPIGIYAIMLAKAMGASRIFATDINEYRLNMAKMAGADVVLNPRKEDTVKAIKDATNGLGPGTVFEFSGNVDSIKQGFSMLRKCGCLVMGGLPSEPLCLDTANDIVFKAASVYGVYGRRMFNDWDTAKKLITSGQVDTSSVITHRLSLFTEYKKGFELAQAGLSGKIVFHLD